MITHDVDEAMLLADRILLMTNGPHARVAEIVENTLPRERSRTDLHKHPNYYPVRNHLIDFLVTRSRELAGEGGAHLDPRHPVIVRPSLGVTTHAPASSHHQSAETAPVASLRAGARG